MPDELVEEVLSALRDSGHRIRAVDRNPNDTGEVVKLGTVLVNIYDSGKIHVQGKPPKLVGQVPWM